MKKIWDDKERAETKKICFKCKEEKSLLEYYRHTQMKDGHLNKCKSCAKKDSTGHRDTHIEKVREYDRTRARLPHRIKLNTENTKRFRKESPLAYKAHGVVARAIRSGKLIRPDSCSVCEKNWPNRRSSRRL